MKESVKIKEESNMSNYRKFKKEAMSMLTKENFVAIADILAKHTASEEMIREFGIYFERTNPRFDYERFKDYINSKQQSWKEQFVPTEPPEEIEEETEGEI